MIQFELSKNDRKVLDFVREEALVCRGYARHYDENEHEFPPEELPEASQFPGIFEVLSGRGPDDSGMAVMSMLISAGQTWGDYSVRMRRGGHWTSGDSPIPLFDDATIGEGFVYIPRGPFEFGGEGPWGAIRPRSLRGVDGFFASIHAVTMGEYAVLLTARPRRDPGPAWNACSPFNTS